MFVREKATGSYVVVSGCDAEHTIFDSPRFSKLLLHNLIMSNSIIERNQSEKYNDKTREEKWVKLQVRLIRMHSNYQVIRLKLNKRVRTL